MQLTRRRSRCALLALFAVVAWARPGAVQAEGGHVGATTTVFHEAGTPLKMTVITPAVDADVDIGDSVTVRAGWEADIVTGASVAIVDAPSTAVDVITSATTLDDQRHTVGGAVGLKGDQTSLEVGFTHGRESDYRSNAFQLTGSADLFERNTTFTLSYGRGFDEVCDLAQPGAQEAVDRQRMPGSEGCFGGADRVSRDLDIQTFQGGWTQAWTPILSTQVTLTTQILNGYQGNPYRAVWLGRTAAQENHPENRARYAAGLGVRLWIEPLSGALQAFGRVYRDTWDVESVTAELAYEQSTAAGLRVRARARYYNQSRASFYSDDYVRFPRGQYFTGDRELSTMSSWVAGGQLAWDVPPGDDGDVLGLFGSFQIIAKADIILYDFENFHYGSVAVPNDTAYVVTLDLQSGF